MIGQAFAELGMDLYWSSTTGKIVGIQARTSVMDCHLCNVFPFFYEVLRPRVFLVAVKSERRNELMKE